MGAVMATRPGGILSKGRHCLKGAAKKLEITVNGVKKIQKGCDKYFLRKNELRTSKEDEKVKILVNDKKAGHQKFRR